MVRPKRLVLLGILLDLWVSTSYCDDGCETGYGDSAYDQVECG